MTNDNEIFVCPVLFCFFVVLSKNVKVIDHAIKFAIIVFETIVKGECIVLSVSVKQSFFL